MGLPGVGRRRFVALVQLSLGRLLLSRACFCFTGQMGVLPVSVSLRVYRRGNGKGQFKLVALAIANDLALVGELRQSRAKGGGANAAEFLQLARADRLVQLGQGLADALGGRWWAVGWKLSAWDNGQRHC